jgi:hypothetical protein
MKKLIAAALATLAVGATAATAAAPASVTLNPEQRVVFFGGSAALSGTVSPVVTGQNVAVTVKPQDRAATTRQVTPNADGTYSIDISPRIQTRVTATYQGATSEPQVIFVRPRIGLRKYARSRYAVSVVAAQSFVGRYVMLTRWDTRTHKWRNVKKVFLTRYVKSTGASTAAFRLVTHGKRMKIRAFLSNAQARPGYLFGYSNFIVTR